MSTPTQEEEEGSISSVSRLQDQDVRGNEVAPGPMRKRGPLKQRRRNIRHPIWRDDGEVFACKGEVFDQRQGSAAIMEPHSALFRSQIQFGKVCMSQCCLDNCVVTMMFSFNSDIPENDRDEWG